METTIDNQELPPTVDINALPTFVICPDCEDLHYLMLSKQSNGGWACAYVTVTGNAINGLAFNDSLTIDEAAYRMSVALDRFRRRHGGGQWLEITV
jgi:hypothetical protein